VLTNSRVIRQVGSAIVQPVDADDVVRIVKETHAVDESGGFSRLGGDVLGSTSEGAVGVAPLIIRVSHVDEVASSHPGNGVPTSGIHRVQDLTDVFLTSSHANLVHTEVDQHEWPRAARYFSLDQPRKRRKPRRISNKVAMHVGAGGRVYLTADEADTAAAELQRAAAELRQATSIEVAA